MKSTYAHLLFVVQLALVASSCSLLQPVTEEESASARLLSLHPDHKRVVILPFLNSTDYEDIGELVRKSFYNHFSSKNYYDFELSEVDSAITALEELYVKNWQRIPAQELGKFFHADYIIYGDVRGLKRIYLLFYSQIALTVNARMLETRQGNVVWEETTVKRLHSGDLPLHPLSLFPAALRSGFNIDEEHKMDLVERTCRAIVATIPEVSASPRTPLRSDVQIASFTDRNRAYQVVAELQGKGYTPRIERVRFKNTVWYRVLLGPYAGSEAAGIKKLFAADHRFHPILIHHVRVGKGDRAN